jgi:hypothetical protein
MFVHLFDVTEFPVKAGWGGDKDETSLYLSAPN